MKPRFCVLFYYQSAVQSWKIPLPFVFTSKYCCKSLPDLRAESSKMSSHAVYGFLAVSSHSLQLKSVCGYVGEEKFKLGTLVGVEKEDDSEIQKPFLTFFFQEVIWVQLIFCVLIYIGCLIIITCSHLF